MIKYSYLYRMFGDIIPFADHLSHCGLWADMHWKLGSWKRDLVILVVGGAVKTYNGINETIHLNIHLFSS